MCRGQKCSAQIARMEKELAAILAAAVHQGWIPVQEGLCNALDLMHAAFGCRELEENGCHRAIAAPDS